ncbi:DUF2790 domain-containing protein [Pseudomonas sichuanensis]|uniref:DUF2790 domain-containing protein n=1 Tax=Pseudomonas sichuanensis TaxID=2213015 RepID=UPI0024495AEB|nr:DUF2790 domain-containing protein [Pseudomonas sichuanensis]MDH0733065.1 DUF2790 domain-containing protein [Pseudomonas sichuanensis]MDH1582661.1 DUF2790 domain-containing protein [Pseudomonas sichuanensis]MDH1595553.1 DUF2790 domain-containing protein [Pseudomonas sichuanensis]MDH1597674.1 DUF2790 domain-containing protein [Pseudomonas sichuanensis]
MLRLTLSAALLALSLSAQATGFTTRPNEQLLEDHQQAVAAYAAERAKPMPEVVDYRYGMRLDVARLVRQSADPRDCNVVPRLMTYEDSQGTLRTVRYVMQSQCINNK